MKCLIEVEIEKDPNNEAEAWVPDAVDVSMELWARLINRDLDTGWRVVNTKAVGRLKP